MAWYSTVCRVKIADLVKDKRDIVSVSCYSTIDEALNILSRENITKIVIYETNDDRITEITSGVVCGDKSYLGIVSIVDILHYLLLEEGKIDVELENSIKEVIAIADEALHLYVESPRRPLYFAMEEFCKGSHYALVHDDGDSSEKILTQSDICNYLFNNATSLPHLQSSLLEPVSSIITGHPVCTVQDDLPLHIAVKSLFTHSGVCVVNLHGHIVANLSATDFRGVQRVIRETGRSLIAVNQLGRMTVREFLNARYGHHLLPPITMRPEDPISVALEKMVLSHVHRVWITVAEREVDASADSSEGMARSRRCVPVGVVTMTDVIRAAYNAETR